MSDNIPKRIGKYQVSGILGRGAMGVVYEAVDTVIDRTVAIKKLHAHFLCDAENGQVADTRERFLSEAKAIGSCFHQNIVALFDYGETEDGAPFIVMEHLSGRDLKHYINNGHQFSTAQALKVIRQVLNAVGFAHKRGIVHRDIKPANVVVTETGEVKVTDFGVAHLDQSDLTGTGIVLGTPCYMSPEQLKGDVVDPRSDLWSIGVVLYELLTGKKPFSNPSSAAVMHEILNTTPKMPSEIRPNFSLVEDNLIKKALSKRSVYRFQDAQAFINAIDHALGVEHQEDETVVQVSQAPIRTDSEAMTSAEVTEHEQTMISQEVASHIGPIAPMMVKNALKTSNCYDEFIENVASKLHCKKAAEAFLIKFKRGDATEDFTRVLPRTESKSVSGTASQPLPADILRTVEAELKNFIGPMAGQLMQRASFNVRTVEELYTRLAAHIPSEKERDRFLRSRFKHY